MQHYFLNKEHSLNDFFYIKSTINNITYEFKSCDCIFSKDEVDYGTNLLIKTIIKNANVSGNVLDVGCGYGVIGISIANTFKNTTVDMCDINATAVELSIHNVKHNHIKNVINVIESDAYTNITQNYDFIFTNPPIKAGKTNLLNILLGAKDKLNDNGELWFVIKKKHGEDSIKKTLSKEYSLVEVVARDKGYYILRAVK